MLAAVRQKCVYFAFELYFRVYLFVHRLGIWFRQSLIYRSSPAFRNRAPQCGTILLVGDVLAEGVGDELARGGLAARVNTLLNEHRADTSLKFMWETVTAGKLYTTSSDWLPFAAPEESDTPSASTLFSSTLVTGPFSRAKVVVILVGSHDDLDDAERTVQNIVQIADAAARLEKHVLVGSIPGFADSQSALGKAARARNIALQAALELLPSGEYGGKGSVSFGPDAQRVLVRGGDVVLVENSFITFNGSGYRAYARELHDLLAPLAKRVEWAYWKERL
jgi:hypothetical protein